MKEYQRFLSALAPHGGGFTFQTFPDQELDKGDKERYWKLTCIRNFQSVGEKEVAELNRLSKAGSGIFVTVNGTDLKGRKRENVTEIRSYFVDIDHLPPGEEREKKMASLLSSQHPPSMIVDSRNGIHVYWLCDPGETLEFFTDIQKGLIHHHGGDIKCKDLTRVLRVPGFYHRKGEPYPVRICHYQPELRYTAGELAVTWPAPEEQVDKTWKPQQSQSIPYSVIVALRDEVTLRWGSGSRHELALNLAAKLYYLSVPQSEAVEIVESIARFSGDDDIPDRIRAVTDTYERARQGQPVRVGSLKGFRV